MSRLSHDNRTLVLNGETFIIAVGAAEFESINGAWHVRHRNDTPLILGDAIARGWVARAPADYVPAVANDPARDRWAEGFSTAFHDVAHRNEADRVMAMGARKLRESKGQVPYRPSETHWTDRYRIGDQTFVPDPGLVYTDDPRKPVGNVLLDGDRWGIIAAGADAQWVHWKRWGRGCPEYGPTHGTACSWNERSVTCPRCRQAIADYNAPLAWNADADRCETTHTDRVIHNPATGVDIVSTRSPYAVTYSPDERGKDPDIHHYEAARFPHPVEGRALAAILALTPDAAVWIDGHSIVVTTTAKPMAIDDFNEPF